MTSISIGYCFEQAKIIAKKTNQRKIMQITIKEPGLTTLGKEGPHHDPFP